MLFEYTHQNKVTCFGKFAQAQQEVIKNLSMLLLVLAEVAPFYGLIDLAIDLALDRGDKGFHAVMLCSGDA